MEWYLSVKISLELHCSGDDTATTSFAESQPMSTYLVAFIVSNLQYIASTNARRLRVFARPDELNSTVYALITGEQVINVFERYLQVNYTLPKMDQVAIPHFHHEAMGNWGNFIGVCGKSVLT